MRALFASLLCLATLGLPVFAQTTPPSEDRPEPPSEGMGRGMGRRLDPFREALSQLNLSDQQKEQVKQIMAKNKDLFQQFGDLRRQMREAKEKGDETAMAQIKADMKNLRPQMEAAHASSKAEITKILTPAQQKQLESMRPKRPDKNI